MLKRSFYLVIIAAGVMLVLASCAGGIKTPLNQEVALAINQSTTISGENLTIKFISVTGDSRCATGVECIWQGEVACLLQITQGSTTDWIIIKQPGLTGNLDTQQYKEYQFTFRVEPYPEAGKQIAQGDYRLIIKVSK
jgi:hypothetical protein